MSELGTIIASICAAVAAAGAFYGNRKQSKSANAQQISLTMQALQSRLDLMEEDMKAKDKRIEDLTTEVTVLKGLVTQRADVEGLKSITLKIADFLKVPQ